MLELLVRSCSCKYKSKKRARTELPQKTPRHPLVNPTAGGMRPEDLLCVEAMSRREVECGDLAAVLDIHG